MALVGGGLRISWAGIPPVPTGLPVTRRGSTVKGGDSHHGVMSEGGALESGGAREHNAGHHRVGHAAGGRVVVPGQQR